LTRLFVQYSYLQLLDFLTTLAFLLYGVREANPVVQWFLDVAPSPVAGLAVVKLLAIGLGVLVWVLGKDRLLARINLLFALVVAWNLIALILARLESV
jgi:hypothetical protein